MNISKTGQKVFFTLSGNDGPVSGVTPVTSASFRVYQSGNLFRTVDVSRLALPDKNILITSLDYHCSFVVAASGVTTLGVGFSMSILTCKPTFDPAMTTGGIGASNYVDEEGLLVGGDSSTLLTACSTNKLASYSTRITPPQVGLAANADFREIHFNLEDQSGLGYIGPKYQNGWELYVASLVNNIDPANISFGFIQQRITIRGLII